MDENTALTVDPALVYAEKHNIVGMSAEEADDTRALTAGALVTKRRALAISTVVQSEALATSMVQLQALLKKAQLSGLVFEDADFIGQPNLEHLDAVTFNNIASVITALTNTLNANNELLWGYLQKVTR